MATIRVQHAPFDIAAECAALTAGRDDIGGIGCFIGQVRGGAGLVSLTLEHYPAMTDQALQRVADAAIVRFKLLGCTIVHRIGLLRVGEPIVLVVATSRHRQAALDATRFLIDWLKTDAPFWKVEAFADGSRHWVAPHAADIAARDGWAAASASADS